MSKISILILSAISIMAISSCARVSTPVPVPCPELPPIPENLLLPMTPDLQSRVRSELFEPQPMETGE